MSTTPSEITPGPVAVSAGALPLPVPESPYRGIEPFRYIDQQIFAARTDETWTLLSNVTLYRAVLLYGDSGTGKSSLINAGLLPQAIKDNYIPDRLRVQPVAGREIKVERICRSAGTADYLPSNFVSPNDPGTEGVELSIDAFRERLEKFRTASAAVSGNGEGPVGLPLLIFDQFEEFITLFEEARRVGAKETSGRFENVPKVQQHILSFLVELIQDYTLPVKIIFSFREDYLAKLSLLFDQCPQLLDQAQRLLPPHLDLLPNIIRAPFLDPSLRAHFMQTRRLGGAELSESLARRISTELGVRSEGDRANLTELQIVCQRLWDAPDAEALFAKGVEGILDSYGDDVINEFTPQLRDAAIVLLSHMITASDTRNIISEDDLLTWAHQTAGGKDEQMPHLKVALKSLADSQIVRRERRRNIYFYEITSEYLVRWIKNKVADRKSVVERERAARAQRDLEAKRLEAVAKFETEKKRLRRALVLSASLVVLLIGTFALGIYAGYLLKRAKKAENDARTQKDTTEHVLNAIKLINSQNKDDALKGVAQLDQLIKENRIPTDLKRVLLAPVLTSTDLEVRQAALKVAIYAAKNDPGLSQSVVAATETDKALVEKLSGGTAENFQTLSQSLPTRIYIHISDESQRGDAQKLSEILKNHNYTVPSISNVGINAPDVNQLRYFRKNDTSTTEPKEIVDVLQQATGSQWVMRYISGYENSPSVQPGHFEVWFAASANATNGWLRAYPVNENGTYINASGLNLVYTIKTSEGDIIRRTTGYVPLPVGDYELQITADGYQPVNHKFSITARKTETFPFKLVTKALPGLTPLHSPKKVQ